jgi:hypothetical protein
MSRSIEGSGESASRKPDRLLEVVGELPWLEVVASIRTPDVELLSLPVRSLRAEIEILLVCCGCEAYVRAFLAMAFF